MMQKPNKNFIHQSIRKRLRNAKTRLFNRDSMVKNGNTPFHVLYDDGLATLRHYPALNNGPSKNSLASSYNTPLLIIPPLAVSNKIYDLLEHRSFVKYMLSKGFNIYMIDWGEPTRRDSELGFDYYITQAIPHMVNTVRKHSGSQDISLHGWSLGGLFTLLHTAYSQDIHIKNLFLVGLPIDSHASGILGSLINALNNISERIENKTGYHLRNLPENITHIPGWLNMLMFKIVDPVGTTKSYWHLLKNLADENALVENATKADFLNNMLDYPGAIIKNTAIEFLLTNAIIKGEFKLNNTLIELASITANLFVIAGKEDTLATTTSVKAIMPRVSSQDKTFLNIPGGHVSIISSHRTSEKTWPIMAAWLAERS